MDKIKKGPGRPRKMPKVEDAKINHKVRWSYPTVDRISVKCMWEGKGSLNTDFLDCETSPIFVAGVDGELKWQIKVSRLNEFLENYPFMVVVQFFKNIKHNCKICIRSRESTQTVLKAFDDADNNLECDGVGFNPNEFWDYSKRHQNYIFDIEIMADSSRGIKAPKIANHENSILVPEKTSPNFEIKEQSKEVPKPDSNVDIPQLKNIEIPKLTNGRIEKIPRLDLQRQNLEVEVSNLEEIRVLEFTNSISSCNLRKISDLDEKKQDLAVEILNPDEVVEILKFSKSEMNRDSTSTKIKPNTEDEICKLKKTGILRFPDREWEKESSLIETKQILASEIPELEEIKLSKSSNGITEKESCLEERQQDLETEMPQLEQVDVLRLTNVKIYVSQNDPDLLKVKPISQSQKKSEVEILQDHGREQMVDVGNVVSAPRPSFVENFGNDLEDCPLKILKDTSKEQIAEIEEVQVFKNAAKDTNMIILQDEKQTVIMETEKVADFEIDVQDIKMEILEDNYETKPMRIENADIFMSEQGFNTLKMELFKKKDQDCLENKISDEEKGQGIKVVHKENLEMKISVGFDEIPNILPVEENAEHLQKEILDVNSQKQNIQLETLGLSPITVKTEDPSEFEDRFDSDDQEQNYIPDFETLEINPMQLNIIPELQDFASMINDVNYVDAFLIIEGRKIAAHKCILACRSPFFKDRFTSTMSEIRIDCGMTYETMKSVLIFMYTGCINENEPRGLVGMFNAANSLDVPALRIKLEEVFKQMINKDNAMELFLLADELQCDVLKNCVAKFMI